ncbi:uncharacterized protein LOC110421369 isoform X1 [Herrania umbratica]|uniref:Uncharacterized protein LOC110421369 isoform X1 n=2 Tax=Herrania umbratica TaxID=108875 RepID=A0A6J1AUL4_9ROSI|nr:uncharacterized protein LOC110421369 isoform X1 [Herrania umbratica]
MAKFHRTDCIEILSQIKHQEKLVNLKRRWLMGLSTSRSKRKPCKEPKFFKYKTLPESLLRDDDIFCETIKTHVEEAFGARNFGRGSHVIQHSVQLFDAPKIMGFLLSCLNALTNNGLYLIAMILTGGSGSFEKTRCKMKQVIRESLPRCLSSENHDHKKKDTIMKLYRVLNDCQNFRDNSMKSMTATFQIHHDAAIHVLDGLEDFPLQTLIAMDRKLRCLKRLPQLQACEWGKKRKRLIEKVSKTGKRMLRDLEKGGELREPLAKALAVADLSIKLTRGCLNTSTTCFHRFSPEIITLQNDIIKAIWILKTKVRFPELKTLKLLLDPKVDISNRSLRGAITNMLTEFLFECSDMDTIPKSLLETLAVINKDSRSMPHGRFLKEEIEEEIECILSVSAQLKQIVWDLLPDHELDEEFADAYGEELEDSVDGSCVEDDGQMENEDSESCMSCSVNSIERDEVKLNVKVDPEIISNYETGSEDINEVKSVGKLHAFIDGNCFSPFGLPSGELNDYSFERDEVKLNSGVGPENASIFSSNRQLRNAMFVHNKSRMYRNQYLNIQEASDETSLVAYNLIGLLLEKFTKEQDMDLDWSDSLYLRGDSSVQEHTQGKKQKWPEEDVGGSFIQILKELMPSVPKSDREKLE